MEVMSRYTCNCIKYASRNLSALSFGFFQTKNAEDRKFKQTIAPENLKSRIENAGVLIFSKSYCPYCIKVKKHFDKLNIAYGCLELDKKQNTAEIQSALKVISGSGTVPQIFFRGKYMGGCDSIMQMDEKLLVSQSKESKYDYDLIVIGGGSGGLAMSKRAGTNGAKVALLDYVNPSPHGTTWGLGGTCVNVGCIPKKLMHQAALLRHSLSDAKSYGWEVTEDINHDWNALTTAIQDHIHSLNFGYKSKMKSQYVSYINALGKIIDPHTIKTTNKQGVVKTITTQTIVVATGERPRYPPIPGAKEYAITSDDLFSLDHCPGKTLLVGASYVSLECAGFLRGLGLDVTVMVRSILLRGFDQQIAEMLGGYMEKTGTRFIRSCVPISIKEITPYKKEEKMPGLYEVKAKYSDGTEFTDTYNTVIFAIGRYPCTSSLGLDTIGVKMNSSNRVLVDEDERTNVPNVFAIGDISSRNYQLTPVAIQAGKNLADRLYAAEDIYTRYENIPTTIFTPLEYGAIGLSEDAAIEKLGADNIEVYHSHFQPLEWTIPHSPDNICYAKLICDKTANERIIGFHVLGPSAGEITQGFAIAMNLGATKADFDQTIGIHPTCAEVFTTLHVTKSSGKTPNVTGC